MSVSAALVLCASLVEISTFTVVASEADENKSATVTVCLFSSPLLAASLSSFPNNRESFDVETTAVKRISYTAVLSNGWMRQQSHLDL